MSILDKSDRLRRLWGIALPHIEAPSEHQFLRWLSFGEACVEYASLRTGRRFNQKRNDYNVSSAMDVHRYTTGVLLQTRTSVP